MGNESEILSIAKLFELKKWPFDISGFEKKLKANKNYPNLLSYYDTFLDFDYNCEVLKISDSNIDFLPYPLLSLIIDVNGCRISLINKIGNKFYFFKDKKLTEISKEHLINIWLGIAVLFVDKDFDLLVEDNEIDNHIVKENNFSDRIIGMRNIFDNQSDFCNISFDIIGNDNKIIIGLNTSLPKCLVEIRGNKNTIIIKENCRISGKLRIEGNNSLIKIGNYTTIEGAELSATESKNIEIGDDCMLSNNINIKTSDSHSIIDLNDKRRINLSGNVIIKNHVWICPFVNILKNVSVESNCIIATSSLVTKNMKGNSLYGGIPAKQIKTNVSWKRELII